MPKFTVRFVQKVFYEVEVEAKDREKAVHEAFEEIEEYGGFEVDSGPYELDDDQ